MSEYEQYRRYSRRSFEGVPQPTDRGAFHGDARFQLREVVMNKKRPIEVAEPTPDDPDAKKKILIPVITKVDALIWSWDKPSRRWMTRLEWEEAYGPADAPLWVPHPDRPGKWLLEPREEPTPAISTPGRGAKPSAPTPRRTQSSSRPLASKHEPDMSDPHWLARQIQRDRAEAQRAETLRVREERAVRRRVGSGPLAPSDFEAYRAVKAPTHALTLKPHWAHAVMWLGKAAELRDWAPDPELIGERIAIHAGARLPEGWVEELEAATPVPLRFGQRPGAKGQPSVPFASLASDRAAHNVKTGGILGTVLLVEVVPRADGYVWVFRDPRPNYVKGVKGDLGLWPLPPAIALALKA